LQVVAVNFCRSPATVSASTALLPTKECMCEAPGRPGKTIGSSGDRWLYLQSARNSGRLPTPAGTGSIFRDLYALTCAFQAAWSTGSQAGVFGLAEGEDEDEGFAAADGERLGDSVRTTGGGGYASAFAAFDGVGCGSAAA
jgi:hypothetical protein